MPNDTNVKIAEKLIKDLSVFFEDAGDDFVIIESTDYPMMMVQIEFTVYNYFLARLTLQSKSISFSIMNCGQCLKVTQGMVPLENLANEVAEFDENIRLRIPDKYLSAKPWIRN
ncbi:hypothetical protein [uncultured Marinobacter sp.]|uniref:hypothetical protein n=1 Tax=uncultured Marinobacter sp. TaxID=187379 RepID=UPI00261D12CD|nr:hypothetical protein [uncultured Marinobacter sp.]